MIWSMEQVGPTVHRMRVNIPNKTCDEFRILVTSDRHTDSVYSNLQMQKMHMEEAKKNGWPIVDLGDVFDAMQGRRDPRSSRLAMAKCLLDKEEYFDSIVDYGEEFLKPYANNFAMIATGNHETAVLKHNETNLTNRLVKRLNQVAGANVMAAPYTGWLKVGFTMYGTARRTVNIRYTHGHGGSAPVTKGVIQSNRRAVAYPDAEIHLAGHTHDAYIVPIIQERISDTGKVFKSVQWHCQVPSYKDATTGIGSGFEAEKGFMPTPLGAVWLRFKYDRDRVIMCSVELAL